MCYILHNVVTISFLFFVIKAKVTVFCKEKVEANKDEFIEQFKVRNDLHLNIKCLIKIILYQLCYNTLINSFL